jgi:hypothetical protein
MDAFRIDVGNGGNKAGLRGEHEGNRNTIVRGMPAVGGEPAVTNSCALSCTRGCGCAVASGIPCALDLGGHQDRQTPGAFAPREGSFVSWRGNSGKGRCTMSPAAGGPDASLLHCPREAASRVRSHISPGPYRSFRELSLAGSVDPDIWCPPTFVGNSGIECSNGDRGFALLCCWP